MGLIDRFGYMKAMKGEKGGDLVEFGVRAESGSRFGPERLGGEDCHPLARCSAISGFLHVATIGSQPLPSAASKFGIVIKIIWSWPQLRQQRLPYRSGTLSPNHSFALPSKGFRDCRRFGIYLR